VSLAKLAPEPFHRLLTVYEIATLCLRDAFRNLRAKLIAVFFEEGLALTKEPQTFGKKVVEGPVAAAAELAAHEGAKVFRKVLNSHDASR
jgi:hypothetical protein